MKFEKKVILLQTIMYIFSHKILYFWAHLMHSTIRRSNAGPISTRCVTTSTLQYPLLIWGKVLNNSARPGIEFWTLDNLSQSSNHWATATEADIGQVDNFTPTKDHMVTTLWNVLKPVMLKVHSGVLLDQNFLASYAQKELIDSII